jgi:hypothetical protein
MGRPAVYKITDGGSMNEGSFLAGLQRIGFRRVNFSDGFEYGTYYDLHPSEETKGGGTVLDGMGLGQPISLR